MDTSFQTLVLNRLWQAVNVVGVERAFSLLALEHAQVIYAEDGSFRVFDGAGWFAFSKDLETGPGSRVIRTVSQQVVVPTVLLLRGYDRMLMQEMKFNRQNLLERDDFRCQYCGKNFPVKELNMDHVVPRDRGGVTTWENVVISCIKCNSKKSNRSPKEAGMRLLKEPKRPPRRPFMSSLYGKPMEETWTHFIQSKQ
ncbi:MAG: HNH endonuclease [Verrucomicrobiota bacterium]|nr:HNH endonuclease [Verrucomicrobiota bacterium]MEC8655089.1 HNH endonuclease [Verrucomicrobiota bacterium]MED5281698.1 HNH endonuclease [Verrucomicrobiota bacterium]